MKLALAVCMALLAVVLVQAEDGMAPPVLAAATRIANGRPAVPRQLPYMAYIEAVYADGSLWDTCAGSLITRWAVMTRAASCVYLDAVKRWRVRLGSISREGEDPNAWTVESITAMRHPKYNYGNLDNNIAIIHLPRLAPLNEFIQPVHLPSSPVVSSYIGRQAIVAGWGQTSDGSGPSDVLRWAKVLVTFNHYCKQFLPNYAVTDRQLCAGSDNTTVHYEAQDPQLSLTPCSTPDCIDVYKARSGSCGVAIHAALTWCQSASVVWDYGTPLVLYTRGRYTQIGVFSWTNWTFNTPYPAIYTRVSSYIDWIKLYTESDY